jgi:predicted nucleic acid-binding protein
VITFLLDTSALVRMTRDPVLREGWRDHTESGVIGSCYPQRAEYLYGARDVIEYDEITELFAVFYPDVAVPKTAGRWIESVQHRMARAGEHRSASAVDLIIAATAAHCGLTVLHDDDYYRAVARHASELGEHNIHDWERPAVP